MTPQLNHLIVWSTDRRAAAQTFADVMGMGPPTDYGHFTQVEAGNGVMLDPILRDPGGLHIYLSIVARVWATVV